jgi:hypothetical protein
MTGTISPPMTALDGRARAVDTRAFGLEDLSKTILFAPFEYQDP